MERKEKIAKKARNLAIQYTKDYNDEGDEVYDVRTEVACLEMAEWIDAHMPTLYVVTRCEEHSDYVERVFINKEKAEEYCKQFEGNENAYGRNITEINATL